VVDEVGRDGRHHACRADAGAARGEFAGHPLDTDLTIGPMLDRSSQSEPSFVIECSIRIDFPSMVWAVPLTVAASRSMSIPSRRES
jgi:hypothetical protein